MNIYIFRRDLRIFDNNGINFLKNKDITPIFIYDKRQIDRKNNKYFSHKCVQFLDESLNDLDKSIKKYNGKLNFFYGNSAEDVIRDIIKNNNISSITFVKDYTKFSNNRDNNIRDMCTTNNIKCNIIDDITLYDINKITTKSGNPYKKFKWFYKSTQSMNVLRPSDKSKLLKFNSTTLGFAMLILN